jgi:hypothetical protein
MSTQLVVDELMPLPDGTFMVRGTRIEGPRIEKGQRGKSTNGGVNFAVEVVGTGVIDPNLDATGRQGLLLKLAEGNAVGLRGLTLVFAPLDAPTPDSPPQAPRG